MSSRELPYRTNPLLRWSYSLIAPVYDFAVWPLKTLRRDSLRSLPSGGEAEVLISGAGTGLDLPLLPERHRYTALDFNAAMLSRARQRGARARGECLRVDWVIGDSMALPFSDAHFDCVVLHLILAVVAQPELCLGEAERVLKPGGKIIILDKFLRPNQSAVLRRALNPLARRFATRLDVVFEEVLQKVPSLHVVRDEPILARGWFRGIVLHKEITAKK